MITPSLGGGVTQSVRATQCQDLRVYVARRDSEDTESHKSKSGCPIRTHEDVHSHPHVYSGM